jgi:trimethylamine--corrinoid protein Co-methyltransferase
MARRARVSEQKAGRLASQRGIQQLPFREYENPFPPMSILSDDQIELLHRKSLELLRDFGCNFLGEEARAILKQAGAEVEPGGMRVRFDPAMVEQTIATAPKSFRLHSRNPAHDVTIGGAYHVFSMAGSTPNSSDIEGGRRPGNREDYRNFLRLSQSLNICHGNQAYPVEPTDIPTPIRHLEAARDMVHLSDKTYFAYGLGRQRLKDVVEIIRLSRGLDWDQFTQEPTVLGMANCNSPLQYDTHLSIGIIELARLGQAMVITPFTLAGAMSPVTLAGTLVQHNAEALAGIVLSQAAKPGAPVVYGAFASNVDMRTGAPAFGTPEYVRTTIAAGQLARRYGLPYRSSAPSSSNAPDAQATYETAMSIWPCMLSHANIVKHAFGWLEGGLCASFEKVIIDAEITQIMVEAFRPIDTSEDELAIDAIMEVGPGGHYFGSQHTIERYENAFYQPMLSDWRNFETWQEDGSCDALARANGIYKQLLADYVEPPIDPAIADAVDAYVDRRVAEGGAEYGT